MLTLALIKEAGHRSVSAFEVLTLKKANSLLMLLVSPKFVMLMLVVARTPASINWPSTEYLKRMQRKK